jgi:hypothetical protein
VFVEFHEVLQYMLVFPLDILIPGGTLLTVRQAELCLWSRRNTSIKLQWGLVCQISVVIICENASEVTLAWRSSADSLPHFRSVVVVPTPVLWYLLAGVAPLSVLHIGHNLI